jgi:hypothetical protein
MGLSNGGAGRYAAAPGEWQNCTAAMNLRRIIPTDITASVLAHLSLLALLLLFSEVHQFGEVTAETIPVDVVTPQEIAEKAVPEHKPEPAATPTPTPQPDFSPLDNAPTPAPQQSAPARPQKQAATAPSSPAPPPPAASPPQAQSAPPAPGYTPPEPDLSIKYHVLLGLPQDLSPTVPPASPRPGAKAGARTGDNFDAPAFESADLASTLVTEFRHHLRTCSKLPDGLKASDDVKVKLRVLLKQDGTLASDPILIEASASMKGPLLMQGAVSALRACQPYAMLPLDRYGEWKVLDLSFTPQDF